MVVASLLSSKKTLIMKATRNNPFVRPHRKTVSTWLAAAAIAGAPGTSWSDIIAYNFSENPGNQVLDNTTPKGPTGTSQWNDSNAVDNGGLAAGDEAGLLDDTGAATSASIAWSSSNVWWNGSGTGSEEARVVVGYLDDGGAGVSVTVSNIPYAAYNVYGIVGSDSGDTYTTLDFQVNGTWALGGAAATTATAFGNWGANSANGVWTEIDPGVTTGNYWKVEGVTGGNLTIQGQPRNGAERGTLTAIIIEEATFSAPSFVDKPGITNLPALALGDGLTSTFRPGLDAVTITDIDGLSLGAPGETHTLRIVPSATTLDDTYTLLDYDGTFGGAGFGGLVLEPIPNPRYTLNLADNVPNTSVDLVYAGPEPIVWAGGSGAWDTTNTLWNLESGGTPTSFIDLDIVKFPDQGASPVAVTLDEAVSPLSTSFENSADDYVLSGTGAIAGSTALSVSGGGSVTLETANSFTGPVSVSGGSTLAANQAASLGATGGAITLDDGTLAASVGFNTAKVLTVGAGGGTVDVPAAETLTFTAGGFKGGNTLVKTGDGVLRFAGYNANGFAGDLDIQSGTVEMAGGAFNGNIGLGSITVRSGATLNHRPAPSTPSAATSPPRPPSHSKRAPPTRSIRRTTSAPSPSPVPPSRVPARPASMMASVWKSSARPPFRPGPPTSTWWSPTAPSSSRTARFRSMPCSAV